MIRYCDDFVICVEREDDARELLEQLEQRLGRGKLRLSMEKTNVNIPMKFSKRKGKKVANKYSFQVKQGNGS